MCKLVLRHNMRLRTKQHKNLAFKHIDVNTVNSNLDSCSQEGYT